MSRDKSRTVGRTLWDFLTSLLQERKYVTLAVAILLLGAYAAFRMDLISMSWLSSTSPHLRCDNYGISLTERNDAVEAGDEVIVSGGITSKSEDYELWVVARGAPSRSIEYWPRDVAAVSKGAWRVRVQPGLKDRSDVKRFAVFLVGPEGQKLMRSYKDRWSREKSVEDQPGLTVLTSDTAVCDGLHTVVLK